MISFPDCEVVSGLVCLYQLDWLIQARPPGILPLCCRFSAGRARLRWLIDGLSPAATAARRAASLSPDPLGWLRQTLRTILATLSDAENALVARTQFVLRPSALWFEPGGAPVVACLPAAAAEDRGSMVELADALLRELVLADPDVAHRPAFPSWREALAGGEPAFVQWLSADKNSLSVPAPAAGDSDTSPVFGPRDDAPMGTRGPGEARVPGGLVWLALPALFSLLPVLTRWLWPGRLRTNHWRVLAAAGLGLTALTVACLLFWPASPLYCGHPDDDTDFHPGGWLRAWRRDIRMSGLLGACAARMGQAGRLGAHTRPLPILDENTRLGFLSEREPGSPEEAQGIRAYILTAQFVIGRDPDLADLVLPDAELGRAHARIEQHNGSFFITDLGSYNGTFLDGRRLPKNEQVPLPDRCVIGVAERHFHFTVD